MSQIIKPLTSAGPIPPLIPTQFNTDSGNAIPSGNILIVHGTSSTQDTDSGIISKGNTPATPASNEVDIVLTNRITGTATTTDGATPQTLFTFALDVVPTSYFFTGQIVAYNITSSLILSTSFSVAVGTDGVTARNLETGNIWFSEEGLMSNTTIIYSTSSNSFRLRVQGYNTDEIHWRCLVEYIKVS